MTNSIGHDLLVQTHLSVRRVEDKQDKLKKVVRALAFHSKEIQEKIEIIREGVKCLAANGLNVNRAKSRKYFPFENTDAMHNYVAQDPQCVLLINR